MTSRFIAKKSGARWGVYDTQRASWPRRTPELGSVKQDHPSEESAKSEAERCIRRVAGNSS